jgi:hypothetical protein
MDLLGSLKQKYPEDSDESCFNNDSEKN